MTFDEAVAPSGRMALMWFNKFDTEDKIETEAERMQDRLDSEYMKTDMSEDEYLLRCDEINLWVELRYEELH